jgi:DnaK suppressor protein
MALDQKFVEEVKKKLEKEKEQVKERLKKVSREDFHEKRREPVFLDFGNKPDENAAEVAMFQDRLTLERELEKVLEQINKALKKIKEGKYGLCEKCGQQIDSKRLTVFPTAELCLKCKQQEDKLRG